MTFFFDIAYALVIFVALLAAGALLGALVGLAVPIGGRRLLLPAVAVALAGWIWLGWMGGRYGISRLGLVVYSAVGAAGFVRGWLLGLVLSARVRRPNAH